jgi:branched-chain amino acid transport system permease protein
VLAAPPAAQVFLTVGLLIAIENGALLLFGSEFRSVAVPYQIQGLRIGGVFVSVPYLYSFGCSLVLSVALRLYLSRSWTGRAIRAVAQDPVAATLAGVDTQRTYALAFGLGVALTAFGGAIILPYIAVSPTIGSQFAILMFTAVVLGGLGSVSGALVGGFAVGIIQSVSALVFPVQLQNLCLFVVFIAVLSLRPQGLIRGG